MLGIDFSTTGIEFQDAFFLSWIFRVEPEKHKSFVFLDSCAGSLSTMDQTIRELLSRESEDEFARASCDVLRALTILGGRAWHSDLIDTLMGLWSIRTSEMQQTASIRGHLDDAIRFLNEKQIIISEKKQRADLSGSPVEELLHSSKDYFGLLRNFGGDREVLKYTRETSR